MPNVRLKSAAEIARLAEIGEAASEVLSLLCDAVAPGVSAAEIDGYADELIAARGYQPTFKGVPGYRHATCINVNDCVAHGIPGSYRFETGDLVGIDVALSSAEGLCTDTAWTVLIGEPYPEAERLLRGTQEALKEALALTRAGATTADLGEAIAEVAERYDLHAVQHLSGHGTGYELHEDPVVPNHRLASAGVRLEEGLVLAVEPMFTTGSGQIIILDDRWSVVTADGKLSALFELSVALTADGLQILTPPPRPWIS